MDKNTLFDKLTDLGMQGGKKFVEMTVDAIEAVTPVIAEKSEKAVSFLSKATDQSINVNENDLRLEAYVDQFRKDLIVHVQYEGKDKYTFSFRNTLFSTQLVLYTHDGFEIGYVKMKEHASRHGKSESNPVDFELFMGKERFSMIRSFKEDRAKRTYVYDDWKIERPVFGKDFSIFDHTGKRIALLKQEMNTGDYKVFIDNPKNEIRVLFALAAMECEYVK